MDVEKRAVHARFEYEQVADMDGLNEIDVIHCRRHHVRPRMPVSRHGAGQVDEVHQSSAQQVAERVGVVGQDDFGHFRLRIGDQSRRHRGFGGTHLLLAPCIPADPVGSVPGLVFRFVSGLIFALVIQPSSN